MYVHVLSHNIVIFALQHLTLDVLGVKMSLQVVMHVLYIPVCIGVSLPHIILLYIHMYMYIHVQGTIYILKCYCNKNQDFDR